MFLFSALEAQGAKSRETHFPGFPADSTCQALVASMGRSLGVETFYALRDRVHEVGEDPELTELFDVHFRRLTLSGDKAVDVSPILALLHDAIAQEGRRKEETGARRERWGRGTDKQGYFEQAFTYVKEGLEAENKEVEKRLIRQNRGRWGVPEEANYPIFQYGLLMEVSIPEKPRGTLRTRLRAVARQAPTLGRIHLNTNPSNWDPWGAPYSRIFEKVPRSFMPESNRPLRFEGDFLGGPRRVSGRRFSLSAKRVKAGVKLTFTSADSLSLAFGLFSSRGALADMVFMGPLSSGSSAESPNRLLIPNDKIPEGSYLRLLLVDDLRLLLVDDLR